jgi:hypothetical protein
MPEPGLVKEPAAAYRHFRRHSYNADLCVCGGGISGVCAAITAARQGVQVILIQDRPVLGGNASSEVRLWILGATSHMFNNNRYAREGGVVDEILTENMYRNPEGNPVVLDTVLLDKIIAEDNILLLLNTTLTGCQKSGDRIEEIRAFSSQSSLEFDIKASLFADCTGDGSLGFLAGAPFRIGAELRDEFGELFAPSLEYGHLLGHSIYFYSKDTGRPVKFVPPTYALADLETEIPRYKTFNVKEMGCQLWWIEYGGRLDTIHDTETIKWELWRVVYGVWNYFKNSGKFPQAETLTLEWVGTIPGKRESRRFVGPYMIKQQDIIEQQYHPDAVSFGGWSIDLHPADGVFSEIESCTQWHSKGVYQIPFSTMICPQIPNLLYGGRAISATHVAFGSTRVMATSGNNGNALGMAAAMCKSLKVDPVALLQKDHMKSLQCELMRYGQYIPGYKLNDPLDLVRKAKSVKATSELEVNCLPSDGPLKVLTRSLAQMIPLPKGRIPVFEVTVQAIADTEIIVQLRGSRKAYNYTPEVIIAARTFAIESGESSLNIDFQAENPQDQYVFLCLLQNEAVAVCTTLTRISGFMTVEHECTQSPPEGIGIDSFERWTPVRRPMGHNLALKVSPPIKAWATENIRNGVARPTKRANCWVPVKGGNGPQMLKIQWEKEVQVKRLVVCFDGDFDHGKCQACSYPKFFKTTKMLTACPCSNGVGSSGTPRTDDPVLREIMESA